MKTEKEIIDGLEQSITDIQTLSDRLLPENEERLSEAIKHLNTASLLIETAVEEH